MSNYFENSEEKRINCEGGFGIIPFYLSIDKSIPDGAKLLFSDMWLAQLQTGYCSLSNSELAKIRNVSSRTITTWISLLKEKGWIKTQYIITQQGEIKQRNIYLNPKPEINNIAEKISEADFVGYRNQLLGGTEASFQVYNIREEIIKKNILPKTGFGDVEISSVKSKKIKTVDDWKSNEAFTKLWYSLPEYMRRCGGSKGYKAWKQETKNGTVNVENIDKATRFYLMNLQDGLNPQYLSTFLNQGTWDEFYTRAVEQEQKQEKARVLREKQQKEEVERRKQVLKERAQVFETKYQVLKNKLNAGYDTLEEISQKDESLFYDIVDKIREYERKLEEKEAERKKQQELEQKKIDAEKSKIALEDAERELWTYVEKTIDVNAYLERNKKKFPNSYEKFKALFFNGESLTDVVFGEHSKNPVVDSLKNNILVFLMHELSNEDARSLYNKRNEAWTIWNKTQKEIV